MKVRHQTKNLGIWIEPSEQLDVNSKNRFLEAIKKKQQPKTLRYFFCHMVTTPLLENPCNVGTSPSPEACRLSSEDGMFLSQYLEIYMMLPEFLNDFLLTVFKNDAFEWPLYFAEMAPLRKSVVDAFLRWLYWNQDGSTKTSNTIEVVLVILEHKTWRVHWIQIYNKTARRCPGMELMINWLVRITGVFQPLNKNEVDLTWNILMINHWSEQFQRDESQGRMEDLCWKKTPSTWNLHDFSQRRIMFCVNPPHVFFLVCCQTKSIEITNITCSLPWCDPMDLFEPGMAFGGGCRFKMPRTVGCRMLVKRSGFTKWWETSR